MGPWALGTAFTPFPIDLVNDALGGITIAIPNALGSCGVQQGLNGINYCLDNFHIDCSASGEQDPSGHDIYKVILKLGTSD